MPYPSPWQTLFNHLQNKGVTVFSPGQHQGECTSPYVVISNQGLNRPKSYSSTQTRYDLMCYVPQNRYSELESFVEQIKDHMRELYPQFKPLNFETGSFLDDTVKGHMISVQYGLNRKL